MRLISKQGFNRQGRFDTGKETDIFFSNGVPDENSTPFSMFTARRAMIGDASTFPGATAGNNNSGVDFLTDDAIFDGEHDLEYFLNNARLGVTTKKGIAGAFAATNQGGVAGDQAIAVAAHAQAHDARAWAIYADAVRIGPHTAWVAEFQICNKNVSPTAGDAAPGVTPYGRFLEGGTRGLTIGSGADPAVHVTREDVDVALYIAPNGARFFNGITYGPGALVPWSSDGIRRAINMQTGTAFSWWIDGEETEDPPVEVFKIVGNVTEAGAKMSLIANDVGITIQNDAGHPFFFINNGPNGVQTNYLQLIADEAGKNPFLASAGVDGSVNIGFQFKGGGTIFAVLPTSNAGLSTGEWWNDGGTVKIVA